MTIFLHVATHFILKKIAEQITSSLEKDQRLNHYLFNNSRNVLLSTLKRELLTTLQINISDLTSAEDNDEAILTELTKQLTTCLNTIKTASIKHRHSAGSSEQTLIDTLHALQLFYNKSRELRLTDQTYPAQENELSAFILLLRACAFYTARRIFDEPKVDTLQNLLQNPNINPVNSFHNELDHQVNKKLELLWRTIDRLKVKAPEYEVLKNDLAYSNIQDLLAYQQLMHYKCPLSPMQLVSPLPNYLHDYLQDALNMLSNDLDIISVTFDKMT